MGCPWSAEGAASAWMRTVFCGAHYLCNHCNNSHQVELNWGVFMCRCALSYLFLCWAGDGLAKGSWMDTICSGAFCISHPISGGPHVTDHLYSIILQLTTGMYHSKANGVIKWFWKFSIVYSLKQWKHFCTQVWRWGTAYSTQGVEQPHMSSQQARVKYHSILASKIQGRINLICLFSMKLQWNSRANNRILFIESWICDERVQCHRPLTWALKSHMEWQLFSIWFTKSYRAIS